MQKRLPKVHYGRFVITHSFDFSTDVYYNSFVENHYVIRKNVIIEILHKEGSQ